jgi:hypothetical protein
MFRVKEMNKGLKIILWIVGVLIVISILIFLLVDFKQPIERLSEEDTQKMKDLVESKTFCVDSERSDICNDGPAGEAFRVCGDDGKTYSSSCFACGAGVSYYQKGSCSET